MRGHVYRNRGRWYVRLEQERRVDPETGEIIRRRSGSGGTGYRTKREAEAALHDALDAARQGWRGPSRVTVAEYLRGEWLPAIEQELAPTTARLYQTLMESYVIRHLGDQRLESIMPEDLTRLYAELSEHGGRGGRPLGRKTVRNVHTTLRRALADAVGRRHLAWNPAASVKGPRVDRSPEPKHWTPEELRTFLHAAETHRLEAAWTLAATTGMRREELLGLEWRDVELDGEPVLHVRRAYAAYREVRALKEPKTPASRRTIPLAPLAVAALKRQSLRVRKDRLAAGEAYEDRGVVFADELGDRLEPEAVSKAFTRFVASTGLRQITMHGLRHTFATLGLEAGVDVLEVAAVIGHSSPAITQSVYQHTRPERKRDAVERIERSISG